MRRAARIDDNQAEIIAAFRKAGCSVKPVHTVKAFVDIIVGYRGKNWLVEIKDGKKPPSSRRLTTAESEFHRQWQGQVCIVESIEDVAKLLEAA